MLEVDDVVYHLITDTLVFQHLLQHIVHRGVLHLHPVHRSAADGTVIEELVLGLLLDFLDDRPYRGFPGIHRDLCVGPL